MPTSTYRTPRDLPTPEAQHQARQPGSEREMRPQPVYDDPHYKPAGKLCGCLALVTGGDSGIGRAVAIAFAKEGADVAIAHLTEGQDADVTKKAVEALGRTCTVVRADLREPKAAARAVEEARGGRTIDVLVNNAAIQMPQNSIEDISPEQLGATFATNVLAQFHVTKAALPHMKAGGSIINTASVTAFQGNPRLIDYTSTKGAIVGFTRALALSLAGSGIRVNAVAPGPVWTPLIPASFTAQEVARFGQDVPLGRAAQPFEVAPTYVYLASEDSAYVTGQVLHVNGGTIA